MRRTFARTNQRLPLKPSNTLHHPSSLQKSSFSTPKQHHLSVQSGAHAEPQQLSMRQKTHLLQQLLTLSRLTSSLNIMKDRTFTQWDRWDRKVTQPKQRRDQDGGSGNGQKRVRIRAEKESLGNSRNFSQLMSEFETIPEEEATYLHNIQNQIKKIKKTLNSTYDLFRAEQDKAKKSQKMLDQIVNPAKRHNKKRVNISNLLSSNQNTHRQQMGETNKRRREFETEREPYLPKGKQNSRKNLIKKPKKGETQRSMNDQSRVTQTVTHQIVQPVIHKFYQPIYQTFIPALVSPTFTQNRSHMSFFPQAQRDSFKTLTPRHGSSYQMFSRPVTSRCMETLTPRTNFTISFY